MTNLDLSHSKEIKELSCSPTINRNSLLTALSIIKPFFNF